MQLQAAIAPSVWRKKPQMLRLAGLLALVFVGCLLVGAGVALASSPLSWSSPTLISPGPETPPALNGVSCPSTSLCVVVDGYGNVISSSQPTSAASWRVSRSYVGRAEYRGLSAVTCASIDFCLASGDGMLQNSTDPAGGAGAWTSHNTVEYVPSNLSCPSNGLCVGVHGSDVWNSTEPRGNILEWKIEDVDEHTMYGISCPSVSLCVAIDAEGDVLTSSEPTGGKAAWHAAVVDPGHAIGRVSCASKSLCVAGDQRGDLLSTTEPAAGTGAWHLVAVDPGHIITGVSCTGSLCVAVDEAGDVLSSTDPTGGADAWSVAHVDEHALSAVSCASESLCVATDVYGDVLTATDPTGPAVAWALAHINTMTSPPLAAVSCPSALLCVAGGYGNVLTSTTPLSDAGAWRVEKSPEVTASPGLGLSCPSASLCVGAGYSWVSASTEPAGGAPTWKEQAGWVYSPILNPEAEYFGPSGAVSCVSESLCVADGDSFNDLNTLVTSAAPTGGQTQWHEAHIRGSGNKISPPYQADPILGVSCASATLCAAVDAAGNVLTSTDSASNGSTWTIAPVDTHPLEGISCPSEGLCVAVDDAGNVLSSTDPTGGSDAWAVSNIDSPFGLTAVSCATTSLCVAVDDEGDVLTSTNPIGGAGTWSVSDVDSSVSMSRGLTAVSCPSEELCVAVDNAGYAVIGIAHPSMATGGGGEAGGGSQNGGTTTSIGPSRPPLVPVSGLFRILSVKNGGNGQIVLTLKAPSAGSIDARATTSIREAAAGSRRRNTKRARWIAYGTGSAPVLGIGTMTITIRPSRRALDALKSARTLRVPVTVIFHPRSGSPMALGETVTVRYRPPQRFRACSALKRACSGKR
jgi:hypothetical protein